MSYVDLFDQIPIPPRSDSTVESPFSTPWSLERHSGTPAPIGLTPADNSDSSSDVDVDNSTDVQFDPSHQQQLPVTPEIEPVTTRSGRVSRPSSRYSSETFAMNAYIN